MFSLLKDSTTDVPCSGKSYSHKKLPATARYDEQKLWECGWTFPVLWLLFTSKMPAHLIDVLRVCAKLPSICGPKQMLEGSPISQISHFIVTYSQHWHWQIQVSVLEVLDSLRSLAQRTWGILPLISVSYGIRLNYYPYLLGQDFKASKQVSAYTYFQGPDFLHYEETLQISS